MDRSMFSTTRPRERKADTRNKAGGKAYSIPAKVALAKYVVTGHLGETYYANAEVAVEELLDLMHQCDNEWIAKVAVYGRRDALIKDAPALMTGYLAVHAPELFERVAPRVLNNGRMVRNLVQVLRSGILDRTGDPVKNLPRCARRYIAGWLCERTPEKLLNESVGQSPSVADMIKMVHPKASNEEQNRFFAYLIGKKVDLEAVPGNVGKLEAFRANPSDVPVPDVDFRLLQNVELSKQQWKQLAIMMNWHSLRMNLNALARHGVFDDDSFTKSIAARINDPETIRKVGVMPYQLFMTYLAIQNGGLPMRIKLAIQDAAEIAVENVPLIDDEIALCIDVSGSMGWTPVTGNRKVASKMMCRQVAALIAAAVVRRNPTKTTVYPFTTVVHDWQFNPRDSLMSLAESMGRLPSGGTACSAPMHQIVEGRALPGLIWYVSDSESWADRPSYGTTLQSLWTKYRKRRPDARLVLHDLVPQRTTQAKGESILHVGGFSDAVFQVVDAFAAGKGDQAWIDAMEMVSV